MHISDGGEYAEHSGDGVVEILKIFALQDSDRISFKLVWISMQNQFIDVHNCIPINQVLPLLLIIAEACVFLVVFSQQCGSRQQQEERSSCILLQPTLS